MRVRQGEAAGYTGEAAKVPVARGRWAEEEEEGEGDAGRRLVSLLVDGVLRLF